MIMMDSKRKLLVVILTSMFFCELTAAMGFGKFARMFPSQGKSNGTTCGDVAKVREHMDDKMKSSSFIVTNKYRTASKSTLNQDSSTQDIAVSDEVMTSAISTNNNAASKSTRQHIPTQETIISDRSSTTSAEEITSASFTTTGDNGVASESTSQRIARQESTRAVSDKPITDSDDLMNFTSSSITEGNDDVLESTSQSISTQKTTLSDISSINSGDDKGDLPKSTTQHVANQESNVSDKSTTSPVSTHPSTTAISFPSCFVPNDCLCQGPYQDSNGCENNGEGDMICCYDGVSVQGGNCVPKEECGCYVNGLNTVIAEGESRGCQPAQKCINGILCVFDCNNDYAECGYTDNAEQCVCKSGFYGNGQHCFKTCEELHDIGYIKPCKDEITSGYSDKTCYFPSIATEDCKVAKDCNIIYNSGHHDSGYYYIRPDDWQKAPFQVYCEGEGWTVIQRRKGSEIYKFGRNWQTYKSGFSYPDDSFWLGNDKLHFLTIQDNYELCIEIRRPQNAMKETCKKFRIKSEDEQYILEEVTDCALSSLKGEKFSTYDRNNAGNNCGESRQGGWWYESSNCGSVDLNGNEFFGGGTNNIEYIEMKIRPKQ